MKKAIFFLVILAISRIGVAFAADTTPTNIGNFFLNNTNFDTANVNQILGLLVGPSGPPGPAGVAGSNGFNGLNGVAGMPGAPGAMGATGPQGIQGVQGVAGPAGANGGQGPAGPAGPKGDAGTGGGVYGIGGGSVAVGTCDQSVDIAFPRSFDYTSGKFRLNSISLSKISNKCDGQTIHIYFKVGTKEIVCAHPLSDLYAGDDANNYQFSGSSECTNKSDATPFDVNQLDVNNLETYVGVEIS
jgi:hypothetical protein